ncbi:EAL and HDOD domain-containing protein [Roseateles toxinivorans]|uniref:EAL and modified HD-GYP domain-containing signal transduction protein n=1 Tax=Roseateles toxinivorans TaxID=270368 RepID=A0A4R6QN98_9BURK|nr:HDOD domain-containing protein [Roseateles toxinivorans]TDP71646.1 EAL and modified HD-GYP domain-containing signal transduction protein [Roseateles toxinivorans]
MTSNHPILDQVVLGYSPMIDRNRMVMATRLTVFPIRPDASVAAAPLLAAVNEVWPAEGGLVSLNVVSESLLHDLMEAKPSANLMIEVPAFIACNPAHAEALLSLRVNGNTLLIKGRPLSELPRDVLPCFKYSIIDLEDDRRLGDTPPAAGVTRSIEHVQSSVHTLEDMEASFRRGAVAVLGWPMEHSAVPAGGKREVQADLQVIIELMARVDAAEPIEKMEATLRRDPSLAFKLMRYLNSAAFGLTVEVSSFRHAIMLLGYSRLKRWLALLLTTASKDANMRPVMFAAVRRGLLMEELAGANAESEVRDEMFICGMFSLLDRMLHQPFDQLLKTVPVPERVSQALAKHSGPYHPYMELARAIEAESLFDFRAAADTLMLSAEEINHAVLRALGKAKQLD